MIRYALRCSEGHEFEGWFRSSQIFESQRDDGLVTCTRCGITAVDRALMAPALPSRRAKAVPDRPAPEAEAPAPDPAEIARSIAELRAHVEANSNYVGMRFVSEARAMHEGHAPHRPIHGEAKPEEARQMIEDGLPVAPLPFLPKQRMN
ncbi:DUF1178 family protein [Paracoccus sp. S-4012]|uniref:DUF1178 family protein n=1 Tax=Paracoccus sp. S-4012 TaxID=2665648 RepID=UPI0012B05845|nr:DUF1178 family protein [Paracoccus sp. S-4012]MRX51450.1 DUF1178 family protein [Paracoccus sp. S-4012]